jgi:hypothetical protein
MLESPACTISEIDRDLVFIKSNIFIPKDSRCCEEHVFQKRLLPDAYNEIRPFNMYEIISNLEICFNLNHSLILCSLR